MHALTHVLLIIKSSLEVFFRYLSFQKKGTPLTLKGYRWILPEPSPPASFSTSATVTML